MKVHQEEAQCSHCHKKIDPIGLAMENFDATGRWREFDYLNKKKTKIDPSGKFYRGESFTSYDQFRNIVTNKLNDFNDGLIRNLMSYALGRTVGFSDAKIVDSLSEKMVANDSNIRELIKDIVKLESFKTKR